MELPNSTVPLAARSAKVRPLPMHLEASPLPPLLAAWPDANPQLPVQVLLDLFDQPIHFHPWCVRLTGSAMAALWLSWALRKTQAVLGGEPMSADDLFAANDYHVAAAPGEAWFEAKVEDLIDTMGMSKFEQQSAKRVLQNLGLLDMRKVGLPAKTQYRLHLPRMMEMLTEGINRKSEMA
jgi:hypothetical protein